MIRGRESSRNQIRQRRFQNRVRIPRTSRSRNGLVRQGVVRIPYRAPNGRRMRQVPRHGQDESVRRETDCRRHREMTPVHKAGRARKRRMVLGSTMIRKIEIGNRARIHSTGNRHGMASKKRRIRWTGFHPSGSGSAQQPKSLGNRLRQNRENHGQELFPKPKEGKVGLPVFHGKAETHGRVVQNPGIALGNSANRIHRLHVRREA